MSFGRDVSAVSGNSWWHIVSRAKRASDAWYVVDAADGARGIRTRRIVATDALLPLSLNEVKDIDALFDEDMLGDDLEAWMDDFRC